jgi:hypothetical protein
LDVRTGHAVTVWNINVASDPPRINLEQIECRRGPEPQQWTVVWRLRSHGAESLEIQSARLPHGKLRGEERRFQPSSSVPAGGTATIELSLTFNETPGTVVENAFLLLLVQYAGTQWRIFIRFRTIANSNGEPDTRTELITTQQVGFSGISD